MEKVDRIEAVKTLLGGLAAAVVRISELEIDKNEEVYLRREITQACVAVERLWQDSRHREGELVEQVKRLQSTIDLRAEADAVRQRREKEAEHLRQQERAETLLEMLEAPPDDQLDLVADISECPQCGGEYLVRGARDLCECRYCGGQFQLHFPVYVKSRPVRGFSAVQSELVLADDDGGARFKVGGTVRHDEYGIGRIVEASGSGLLRKIRIRFADSTRAFIAAKARLTILASA